jgi:hypothetical protein
MTAHLRVAVLGVSVLFGACSDGCAPTTTAPPEPLPYTLPERPRCEGAQAGLPTVLGQLGDPRLVEVSGVVPSPTTPDLLWVHNDSGDDAAIYAIHRDGRPRGRVRVPVALDDLEDIAVASCPDRSGPCLYLADTGNNSGDRSDATVVVIAEPVPDADGQFKLDATAVVVGSVDASRGAGLPAGIDIEAMVVAPDGSALYVFEKVDAERARVFGRRGPLLADGAFDVVGTVRTESPAGVQFARMITGADLHPTGTALVVRTYTGVFETRFADVSAMLSLGDVALDTVTFGPFSEGQGEAIAYDDAGTGIITISEAKQAPAADVAVNLLACQ